MLTCSIAHHRSRAQPHKHLCQRLPCYVTGGGHGAGQVTATSLVSLYHITHCASHKLNVMLMSPDITTLQDSFEIAERRACTRLEHEMRMGNMDDIPEPYRCYLTERHVQGFYDLHDFRNWAIKAAYKEPVPRDLQTRANNIWQAGVTKLEASTALDIIERSWLRSQKMYRTYQVLQR